MFNSVSSSDWSIKKLTDNQVNEGLYSMYNDRMVWEAFDGNDYELFYSRPYDIIEGQRYGLAMENGNGSLYQKDGITKIGACTRNIDVTNDYEGLCYFDLQFFSGKVDKAKLVIIFENEPTVFSQECPLNLDDTKCNHILTVYNENKTEWDSSTVNYNSFELLPWDEKIGEILLANQQPQVAILENETLGNLVQGWVDKTIPNNGLVITSELNNLTAYYTVKRVVLIVDFEEDIIQLTNNDIDEYEPKIDKYFISWGVYDDNDGEIYFWNGYNPENVTDNEYDEFSHQISCNQLVWEGDDNWNDYDVFTWKNGVITNLSNNNEDAYGPSIDKGKIVWYGADENNPDLYYSDEIYFYNGDSIVKISENSLYNRFPVIENGMVSWFGYDGNDNEIYIWNEETDSLQQLTSNEFDDAYPKISNGAVAWRAIEESDYEIFYWGGDEIIQVTDNNSHDLKHDFSHGILVWAGDEEGDYDIYYYDSTVSKMLTNNDENDATPVVSFNKILWSVNEYDSLSGSYDKELYLATKNSDTVIQDPNKVDNSVKEMLNLLSCEDKFDFENITVASNIEKYAFNSCTDSSSGGDPIDCGTCEGKVTDLTLKYNGGLSNAYIEVTMKKEGVIYSGYHNYGDEFSFVGIDKKGTMGPEITIWINGVSHIKVHTSCSMPIGIGAVFGDFEIVSGSSRNGGSLCAIGENDNHYNANNNNNNENGDCGCSASIDTIIDNCGPCEGKVASLTLKYKGEIQNAHIEIIMFKEGEIYDGYHNYGDEFSFVGIDKKGTMGPKINIWVNGTIHTLVHTSCSEPIGVGSVFGDFIVVSGSSRNGGLLCDISEVNRDSSSSNGDEGDTESKKDQKDKKNNKNKKK